MTRGSGSGPAANEFASGLPTGEYGRDPVAEAHETVAMDHRARLRLVLDAAHAHFADNH
ncbi:hypothetical protein [Streptomyces zaomyceticus]|uniref:hypothetical protein n=1 Tax=Streptomyces zaomyceticus TaxID=68286 RepID=UPI00342C8CFC